MPENIETIINKMIYEKKTNKKIIFLFFIFLAKFGNFFNFFNFFKVLKMVILNKREIVKNDVLNVENVE